MIYLSIKSNFCDLRKSYLIMQYSSEIPRETKKKIKMVTKERSFISVFIEIHD